MKYIIVNCSNGDDLPFIFPDVINHNDMLKMVTNMYPGYKLVSAGTVSYSEDYISDDKVQCGGHSQTLHVMSREEDTEIVLRQLKTSLY